MASKKTPAKKTAKKTAPKPAKAPKAVKAPKPTKAPSADGSRSALKGGHVPAERYAKDPKSVVARLKEKAQEAGTQAANAMVRAEKNNTANTWTAKLGVAVELFEKAVKALS